MKKFKGFIFDLDGTLVESSLDFQQIRQDIGCLPNQDIISFLNDAPTQERARLEGIVIEHELQDARDAKWLGGAKRLVDALASQNTPMAIVTRNQTDATNLKIKNNDIPIQLVLTRDDAKAKPEPDALLLVADMWQIPTSELIYIGDYLHDVRAANNANMTSCLLVPGTTPDYAVEADIVVNCLSELIEMS